MKKIILFNLIFFGLCLFGPSASAAEGSFALTVTPPLMKMNMGKGESVATAIKVVNNNDRPATIYVRVADFKEKGNGSVEFLSDPGLYGSEESKNVYLSQWITLNAEKIELGPFKSESIPFTIAVPPGALPGGHYAALLVGTNPPEAETAGQGAVIKVSSYISSLIFVKIAGAIEEKGQIREFSADKKIYRGGTLNFSVRFQNAGNVDLRPEGTIKVFDMFGKERGVILVNPTKDYGYVLPGGTREWKELKWENEDFFLFNRYKAELSVSFGDEAKQSDERFVYFWAVNVKWAVIIISSLLVFFILLFLFVKFYIRQSVKNLERAIGELEKEDRLPGAAAPSRNLVAKPLKKPSRKKQEEEVLAYAEEEVEVAGIEAVDENGEVVEYVEKQTETVKAGVVIKKGGVIDLRKKKG